MQETDRNDGLVCPAHRSISAKRALLRLFPFLNPTTKKSFHTVCPPVPLRRHYNGFLCSGFSDKLAFFIGKRHFYFCAFMKYRKVRNCPACGGEYGEFKKWNYRDKHICVCYFPLVRERAPMQAASEWERKRHTKVCERKCHCRQLTAWADSRTGGA